jgi:hypothetical protein
VDAGGWVDEAGVDADAPAAGTDGFGATAKG